MDGLELETVPAEVDALEMELEMERGRSVAGVDLDPAISRLYASHSRAAHRVTQAALRDTGKLALADRVARLRTERVAASEEETWRAVEARAKAIGPDGPAPLSSLELALVKERDRGRRLDFARAAAKALAESASAREAMLEVRVKAGAELGISPDWPAVVEGDELLRSTDDAYLEVVGSSVRRELKLAPAPSGGLTRADLLHLVSMPAFDGLFRQGDLKTAIRKTAAGLLLDLDRLKVDEGERPSQWPGVHVTGARISYRPRGGAGDWQDLLAGLGTALVAAHVPPHRREAKLGGALGWLLGSLVLEPRWLLEHAGVEKRYLSDVRRGLALRRLLALRARAAALRVASEVRRGLSGAAWRRAYEEALEGALFATWDGVRAARDGDAGEQAEALFGAGAGEALRREIRERYDEDWWRNPRTGELLAGLLSAGALPAASEEEKGAPLLAGATLVDALEGKS